MLSKLFYLFLLLRCGFTLGHAGMADAYYKFVNNIDVDTSLKTNRIITKDVGIGNLITESPKKKRNDLTSSNESSGVNPDSEQIGKRFQKREIFGEDDRKEISPSSKEGKTFPLNTVVKIWTPHVRCTGTLIGPWHVLTAAHCIHSGQMLLSSLSAIQIGILQTNGKLEHTSVSDFYIPDKWMNGKDNIGEYDFAVLRMSQPHFSKYMALTSMKIPNNTLIQMGSFPEDKPRGTLWYTKCQITNIYSDKRLYCQCDAYEGSSGASIYINRGILGVDDNEIIGVLSSSWSLMFGWKEIKSANAITKINNEHYNDIKSYMERTKG